MWEWYCSARPIPSMVEIKAWADLYGVSLRPYEINLLRRLAAAEDRVASQH